MKAVLGLAVAMAALACLGAQGALPPPDEHAPGADLHDVPCCGERVLVGSPDGRPACVTPCSARTLLERGWHETDPPGPGHMPATPTKTMTVQSGPWTAKPWGADLRGAGEKLSTLISGPYVPCILPSSLSVEVPEEAAVGKPFDVTITPSFELTPQQLQDFNDLYETDFESARDMWESACDSDRASYYIYTPATYRPSGDGVSHVYVHTTEAWYPPYNYYVHHVDRKFQFGGGSTTVQMTIDEPVIFRVSDVDDWGNQDYFKFDFGSFWVFAGTHPNYDIGPPSTYVYTDIKCDRIRLSDSEFVRQAGTGEPGPDDQFVPYPTPYREYGPGDTIIPEQEYGQTALLRYVREDGYTQTHRDVPFWSIVEYSKDFGGDAVHPATVISAWDLGEEYLENFLNEYPEYRAGAPAYSAPHTAEPPGPQDQDIWVSSDVPFEWIAELLEGDFEGEDPAELIERFGLDDEYVAGFLEAYPQYGG